MNDESGLCCNHCDRWYHTACMGVSPNQYKNLQLSGANVSWFCLTYASSVWVPHHACLASKVEMIQRRAARFTKNDYTRTSSVTSMLNDLQWSTLEKRRQISSLSILHKTLHNQCAVDIPPYVKRCTRSRGDDDDRFIHVHCRTQAYQRSFIPKT